MVVGTVSGEDSDCPTCGPHPEVQRLSELVCCTLSSGHRLPQDLFQSRGGEQRQGTEAELRPLQRKEEPCPLILGDSGGTDPGILGASPMLHSTWGLHSASFGNSGPLGPLANCLEQMCVQACGGGCL